MMNIDLYKNANGSKLFPSRTCKDLKKSQPALKSGKVNDSRKISCLAADHKRPAIYQQEHTKHFHCSHHKRSCRIESLQMDNALHKDKLNLNQKKNPKNYMFGHCLCSKIRFQFISASYVYLCIYLLVFRTALDRPKWWSS
jgi:hypothetical protein